MAGPIGIGASLVGGIFSAFGAGNQAASQSAMYQYQAGIAQQNAQIDKQNAGYALQEGENRASLQGMKDRAQMGQIRAGQGASGFNVNTGTEVAVRASQQEIAGTNETIIRSSAAKQAYDYDVKSAQDLSQASAYSAAGQNAEAAAPLNIMSSIIGTAGSVSSKWLQGSSVGAFSGAF